MKLIDKSAVENILRELWIEDRKGNPEHRICYNKALREVQYKLDTLEVNLENSIICSVDWYDGFLLDYTQEQQDALLEKIGVDVGDKVRIIILKENDL